MAIRFYNTLSRKKEQFKPRKGRKVQIFVCGPTVYDFSHIGHARTYIAYDAFVKYLRSQGYDVFYLQNITDIDDKIIKRAAELKIKPDQLAKQYAKEYFKDMKSLKVDSVDKYANATDYIPQIISQVERLQKKGFAYQIKDGIYYDLSKFPNYGKLAGRTALGAEDAVSRIDEAVEKRNRGDFCLWKFSKPGEPVWKAKIGDGRPGWHIEDTAITETEFGPQYDIHGGANDLIFPHHEAEITQMESISGKQLVKYWVHTGFLNIQTKKMSKSLGNFVTIHDALTESTPEELRFFFLSFHYRSPIDYSASNLKKSKTALSRLNEMYNKALSASGTSKELDKIVKKHKQEFYKNLEDDFNTAKAIASLFDLLRDVNKLGTLSSSLKDFLKEANEIFGVFTKEKKTAVPVAVKSLVEKREKARKDKDWKLSDELREKVEKEGFIIQDAPGGAKVRKAK